MTNHITVSTLVHAPLRKVWACWVLPKHIVHWNQASADWHTPHAESDLREGGKFLWRMEAKDGSVGFDFAGEFTHVEPRGQIRYMLGDGRKVEVTFSAEGEGIRVTEVFEPENEFSEDLQRQGWQAILDSFKAYVEGIVNHPALHWEIRIHAPVEKVFATMLDPSSYRLWTAEFNPTSRYEGSWDKGSKIRFIGEHEGQTGGMLGFIRENIPNRFVSIEYLGELKGDREILDSAEVDDWAGGFENYTFTTDGDHTVVAADITYNADFLQYFEEMWPKALVKLKEICEN